MREMATRKKNLRSDPTAFQADMVNPTHSEEVVNSNGKEAHREEGRNSRSSVVCVMFVRRSSESHLG